MKLKKALEEFATCRVLIYGLTGTGKTTLAASLARKYRLIWVDLENALDTLVKLPDAWKDNIDVIRIPDSTAFPIAAQTLQDLFKNLKGKICEKHGVINCSGCLVNKAEFTELNLNTLDPKKDILVLDSLTQVGCSFLANLMRNQPLDIKPDRDDWGGLRKNTEFFGSSIQRLPCNFVATALCTETSQEDNSTRLVPTFGSRDMGANIPAKFSTLIYTEVKNKKHKAYSSSTASNMFLAKARSGVCLEALEEPDLVPLFDFLLEGTPMPAPIVAKIAKPATLVQRTAKLLNAAKSEVSTGSSPLKINPLTPKS